MLGWLREIYRRLPLATIFGTMAYDAVFSCEALPRLDAADHATVFAPRPGGPPAAGALRKFFLSLGRWGSQTNESGFVLGWLEGSIWMTVRVATAALVHLALIAAAFVCATSPASESGAFVGHVMVEWLDHDDSKVKPAMRLMEDFAFVEVNGHTWRAPKGHIIEGGCIPAVFRSLVGLPFEGKQRRAAVLHDYYCHARATPWLDVHRMFYRASLAAGVEETEAKIMYMAVYAEGQRWEPKEGSRCYNSCHAAAASLAWRPIVTEVDWHAVVEWIDQNNPALAEIEQRVNAATKRPGPHIFAQGH